MEREYLNSIKKQFEYYKSVGEKTFSQLDEASLFRAFNEESNSIAVIVNSIAAVSFARVDPLVHQKIRVIHIDARVNHLDLFYHKNK